MMYKHIFSLFQIGKCIPRSLCTPVYEPLVYTIAYQFNFLFNNFLLIALLSLNVWEIYKML